MKRVFLPVTVTLAMFLGLAWWAAREHQTASSLKVATDKAERAQRRQAAEISELRSQIAAVQKEKAALLANAPAPRSVAGMPLRRNSAVDLTNYVEADPEYPAFLERLMQERIRSTYGDLKQFHLAPESETKLRKLLADRLSIGSDVQAAISKMGYVEGSPEYFRAMGEATGETMKSIDTDIRSLLGKTGVADLESAQRQLQNLTILQSSLGTRLALAGIPMTTDQLTAASKAFDPFQNRGGPSAGALPADQEASLLAAVAQVLTPQQFEIFRQDRTLQQQRSELQRRGMEAAKKTLGNEINSWSMRGP